jgi:hypothetical protein
MCDRLTMMVDVIEGDDQIALCLAVYLKTRNLEQQAFQSIKVLDTICSTS